MSVSCLWCSYCRTPSLLWCLIIFLMNECKCWWSEIFRFSENHPISHPLCIYSHRVSHFTLSLTYEDEAPLLLGLRAAAQGTAGNCFYKFCTEFYDTLYWYRKSIITILGNLLGMRKNYRSRYLYHILCSCRLKSRLVPPRTCWISVRWGKPISFVP